MAGLEQVKKIELVKNICPAELGLMTTVENIAIQKNLFTGTIPTEIGLASNIYFFSVGDNDFESTLPSELGLLDLNITFSVMKNSKLIGTIPTELGSKSIMNIYLQETGLTCTMPNLWCNTSTILKFTCSDSGS